LLLPVLIAVFAVLSASVLAYGTEPVWASLSPHGLGLIIWSRRLEWPLIATSLLLCVALVIVVIAGKRRVWWLIGLLPVLALFYHRFTAGPAVALSCVQNPVFVFATEVSSKEAPEDLVVGIVVDSQPYAFRFAALERTPVVVATVRDKRVILLWSELANRAMVFTVARDLRAEDLEVVSYPDNALLIYNSRLGEFINGLTGRTTRGENPTGFRDPVTATKINWQAWQAAHPDTKLMTGGTGSAITEPAQPRLSLPGNDPSLKDSRRICMIAASQPIAVASESVTDRPLNLTSGQTSLLLVRIDGQIRAFNRELPGDLFPRFSPITDAKHKNAVWVDSDTNSEWSSAGTMVEGSNPMHGYAMTSIPVEDDLYWNVMKFWYPDLHFTTDAEIAAAAVVPSSKSQDKPAAGRKKKNAGHG
jgi:hypothetical protein